MSNVCQITGKRSAVGGKYSNRTRATQFNPCGKRRRKVNVKRRRIFVPEVGKTITLKKVSTRALRTINKKGAYAVLKEAGLL